MNNLDQRMLALLGDRMRQRLEIASDVEPVATRIKASRQTQEDWIQLAEKASQSAASAEQQVGSA